jgi:hypothetical protein
MAFFSSRLSLSNLLNVCKKKKSNGRDHMSYFFIILLINVDGEVFFQNQVIFVDHAFLDLDDILILSYDLSFYLLHVEE